MNKKKFAEKTLSAALATSMVMSMMPYNVLASERGVSIYVLDQAGNAIKGATVQYTIAGYGEQQVATTKEDGSVDILPLGMYVDSALVNFNVTCDNYEPSKKMSKIIEYETQDFYVNLKEKEAEPVFNITPKENLVYTGEKLDLVDVEFKNLKEEVTFQMTTETKDGVADFTKAESKKWEAESKIQATDAGTYYLKFKNGPVEKDVTVTISKQGETAEEKTYKKELSLKLEENKQKIVIEDSLDGKKFSELKEKELKNYTITFGNEEPRTWKEGMKIEDFTSFEYTYDTYGQYTLDVVVENKNVKKTIHNTIQVSLPEQFLGFEKAEMNYSLNVKNNDISENKVGKKTQFNGEIPAFTYSLNNNLNESILIDAATGKVIVKDRVAFLDQIGTGKDVKVKAENKDLGLKYEYTMHFKPNDYGQLVSNYKKEKDVFNINLVTVSLKGRNNNRNDNNLIAESDLNNAVSTSGTNDLLKANLKRFYVLDKNGNVYGPFSVQKIEEEFKITDVTFGGSDKLTLLNGNQTTNYIDYTFNKKIQELNEQAPLVIKVKSKHELSKVTILKDGKAWLTVKCTSENTKEIKDGYEVTIKNFGNAEQITGEVTIQAEDVQGSVDENGNPVSGNVTEKTINMIYDTTAPKVSVNVTDPDFVPSTDPNAQPAEYGKADGDTFYASKNVRANIIIQEKNLFKEDKIIDNAKTTWDSVDTSEAVVYKHKLHADLSKDGKYSFVYTEDRSGNKADYTDIQYIDIDTVTEGVVSIQNTEDKNEFTITITDRNFNPSTFKLFNGTSELVHLNTVLQNSANWEKDENEYTFTYDDELVELADGTYNLNWEYTKKNGVKLTSKTPVTSVIDNKAPVVSIIEDDRLPVSIYAGRKYYNTTKAYKVRVEDEHFDERKAVIETGIKNHKESEWTFVNGGYEKTFTFEKDANVTFEVKEVTDDFGNTGNKVDPVLFTVDKTAPAELKIEYLDQNGNIVNEKTDKFFREAVKAKIIAKDVTSPITYFDFGYKNIPGASEINQELEKNITAGLKKIQFDEKTKEYSIVFDLPYIKGSQVNAKVNYTVKDAAGNEKRVETKVGDHVIVDTINPVLNVNLSSPVQTMEGISYYAGNVTATIHIHEANFDENKVSVLVNGVAHPVSGWTHNGDDHTATVVISGDGDYTLEVSCTDKVGRVAVPFKSNQLTIDTQISNPTLTINGADGNGQSYRGHVAAGIAMEDKNFESYEVHLTRTRYNQHGADVTSQFIHGINTDIHGGSGVFDTFKAIKGNDGIYTLTVTMKDRAGHSSTSTMTFTINRFGSVYVYDEYLSSLIKQKNNFTQKVKKDLVIDEYNPDRLVEGSEKVTILRDGKPIKKVKYDIQETNSGWHQYRYVISKDNFKADGVYKIIVSSKDASGNNPENSSVAGKEILFYVDNTAPEISSVVGLEKDIVNSNKLDVKYNVFDAIGIKKIQIFVDGKEVMKIEGNQLKEDISNYLGKFVLDESSAKQNVRIVVTDLAGNVTDTSAADFTSAYEFNSDVLVSTNFFARYFANKPLFFGTLLVLAAAGGYIYFIIAKRKKDEDEE